MFLVAAVFLLIKAFFDPTEKDFLDATRWQDLPLVEREDLTHNTRRFRLNPPLVIC